LEIIPQDLNKFVGGQVRITPTNTGYRLVGKIKTIVVEGTSIKITLTWFMSSPDVELEWWSKDVRIKCSVDLATSNTCYMRDDGGFEVVAPIPGELMQIVPPGVDLIDPTIVEAHIKGEKVWSDGEIMRLWPQAEGELIGLADHFEKKGASITALQIRLALQLAKERFRTIETRKD
jgi:hypothetical protein